MLAAIPISIRSSDVYKEAVAKAKGNPQVQAELGQPIEEGFFVTGSININGDVGNANLVIPLSGPKGSATLFVDGRKRAGIWLYSRLEMSIESKGKLINLQAK
jgi:hypothetical protein